MDALSNIATFFGRFHPLVVHFPIALIALAIFFEILSYRGVEKYKSATQFIWLLGAITGAAGATTKKHYRSTNGAALC